MPPPSAVSFLLLDATDTSITLSWDREPGSRGRGIVEEVQMRRVASLASPGPEDDDATPAWDTLSSSVKSGAVRKKNLDPGKAYVFRRRSRQVNRSIPWAPLPSLPARASAGDPGKCVMVP